ncbi:MAG: carbohydrate ABC transporter permease [Clostridiales bacterium]|nr:carbohydrate ABC transporter permease [Clostridiales bacterium]
MILSSRTTQTSIKRYSTGEKIFKILNFFILISLGLICLIPFMHVLARSLSREGSIQSGLVFIIPVEFNLESYKIIFTDPEMGKALKFTVILTILGTAVNLIMTTLGAYPLSKDYLKGHKIIWVFILITMFFSGGVIPTYMVIMNLGLRNSIWSLILPGAISVYNLIIMKTFISSIPDSLEEAAKIDGCTEFGILFKIVLPLSIPILLTLALFYGVGHWNQFFDALLYIDNVDKFPLQLKLRQLIMSDDIRSTASDVADHMPKEGVKAAAIIYATIPILIIYPFAQKYFEQGIMIGSVKG